MHRDQLDHDRAASALDFVCTTMQHDGWTEDLDGTDGTDGTDGR